MGPTSTPSFATCLSCMDGRIVLPVVEFIRKAHGVANVDYITEAGMDRFLCQTGALEATLEKIDISLQKHGSVAAYVVGHEDCAGNRVDETGHRKDILAAISRLKTLRSFPIIGGLYVSKDGHVTAVTSLL